MNEVERKALEAAQTCSDGETVMCTGGGFYYKAEDVIRRLSRAGLLRTGLELRAVEAVKAWARVSDQYRGVGVRPILGERTMARQCSIDVYDVGREALALEKKPDVFDVVPCQLFWDVSELRNGDRYPKARFFTESDARAYAAQKNAEEATR